MDDRDLTSRVRDGQHPNSVATWFAKGVCPNPGGKLKRLALMRKLARALARASRPEMIVEMRNLMLDRPVDPLARAFAAAVIDEAAK